MSTNPGVQAGAGSIRRAKKADGETLAKALVGEDPQRVVEVMEKGAQKRSCGICAA